MIEEYQYYQVLSENSELKATITELEAEMLKILDTIIGVDSAPEAHAIAIRGKATLKEKES